MPEDDSTERNSPLAELPEEMLEQQDFLNGIQKVSGAHNADILYFCGDIDRDYANQFFELCQERHPNVLLFLTTSGGEPDEAYRIARFLQDKYANFIVYIDTLCKSAGTLITLGADSIIMSDTAELGPLDVQIMKTDELNQRNSVLNLMVAFDYLQEFALETLEETVARLVENSEGQISTKIALEVASNVATHLFSPIYAQINPITLGDNQRAAQIARQYGERLDRGNLQPDALDLLVVGYPSHSFVIDRREAQKDLFQSVRSPGKHEEKLAKHLRQRYKLQDEQTFVINLTKDICHSL